MDIDYSPTGREFVTGSYDRTVSSLRLIFIVPAIDPAELAHEYLLVVDKNFPV